MSDATTNPNPDPVANTRKRLRAESRADIDFFISARDEVAIVWTLALLERLTKRFEGFGGLNTLNAFLAARQAILDDFDAFLNKKITLIKKNDFFKTIKRIFVDAYVSALLAGARLSSAITAGRRAILAIAVAGDDFNTALAKVAALNAFRQDNVYYEITKVEQALIKRGIRVGKSDFDETVKRAFDETVKRAFVAAYVTTLLAGNSDLVTLVIQEDVDSDAVAAGCRAIYTAAQLSAPPPPPPPCRWLAGCPR